MEHMTSSPTRFTPAVGVAAFGALSSSAGAAHIVAGLQAATLISVGLLLIGLVLACVVHPEPHAYDSPRAGMHRRPARAGE